MARRRAYQGGGRGIDLNILLKLNHFATYEKDPDITFFIDLTADECNKRRTKLNLDRIENDGITFQTNVREQYLKLSNMFSKRFITIDGNNSFDELHRIIWAEINHRKNLI